MGAATVAMGVAATIGGEAPVGGGGRILPAPSPSAAPWIGARRAGAAWVSSPLLSFFSAWRPERGEGPPWPPPSWPGAEGLGRSATSAGEGEGASRVAALAAGATVEVETGASSLLAQAAARRLAARNPPTRLLLRSIRIVRS